MMMHRQIELVAQWVVCQFVVQVIIGLNFV